jgi:4-hydroxythreonine-4-phosphate dehydrogenase
MVSQNPLITLGSPFGIGYEIFLRTFDESKVFKNHIPFCIGSKKILDLFLELINLKINYKSIKIEELEKNADLKIFKFILIEIDDSQIKLKRISDITKEIDGKIAYDSINLAAKLVKDGFFKSIVTLPVSKENINIFDSSFKGHTEFFQKKWNEESVFMTFISKKLNVMLLTTHIPLNEVSSNITQEVVERGLKTVLSLKRKLKLTKKICFLGLNPHAGENGLLGKEELWVKDIIKKYNNENEIDGPIPADTAFSKFKINKYSFFVSCYHDQGLIPFKMLAFEDGVNLSYGMKNIRTSVDHGTGVDLIGKKIAGLKSFENAYKLAIKLSK